MSVLDCEAHSYLSIMSCPTLLCSDILLHTVGCKHLHIIIWMLCGEFWLSYAVPHTHTHYYIPTRTYLTLHPSIHPPHSTLALQFTVEAKRCPTGRRSDDTVTSPRNTVAVHATVAQHRLGCVTVLCDAMWCVTGLLRGCKSAVTVTVAGYTVECMVLQGQQSGQSNVLWTEPRG